MKAEELIHTDNRFPILHLYHACTAIPCLGVFYPPKSPESHLYSFGTAKWIPSVKQPMVSSGSYFFRRAA